MSKIIIICMSLGMINLGCDAACTVIKTAADACNLVEYVGEDGQVHRAKISQEQAESLARESAAKDQLPAPQAKDASDGRKNP